MEKLKKTMEQLKKTMEKLKKNMETLKTTMVSEVDFSESNPLIFWPMLKHIFDHKKQTPFKNGAAGGATPVMFC